MAADWLNHQDVDVREWFKEHQEKQDEQKKSDGKTDTTSDSKETSDKNDTATEKVDHEHESCTPYFETQKDKFQRLITFFNSDGDPNQWGNGEQPDNATKDRLYAFRQQYEVGQNTTPEPQGGDERKWN